jgi:class 3 adenylate cyclase
MTTWSPIRYAHNEGVAIAYTTAGTGDLDVLVIGGFVGHLEISPTLPLAARFWDRMVGFSRLIAFDKRGMGLSDRDVGEYTLENVAEDALAVLDAAVEVELEGPDHLFCAGDQQALVDEVERFLTGGLSTRTSDRVLATVMFTDIVGSTEHATAIGDQRWRDVLERHHRVANREVGRHRGRIVKTTGDGILAAFDGPARAVRAGIALRDAAPSELGVELRIGVHTGECEVIGEDLGGVGVHIAARVQTTAAPGEVLVSSTVKDLVVGSGLRFADRGEHSLKGLSEPWRLHAAVADHSP